jgi:heat-inducible transcriptional repressor
MDELSDRQKLILSLIIHEHVRTAAPVGSKSIVARYNLDMSPATMRNEMAALTEMNYLRQPHTSAGREPTEQGYRYFVGHLLRQTELPADTRRMISHQFYQSNQDLDEWMRLAASILAQQSSAASLVTSPHAERSRLKHLELISTRGRQILMVLVMVGGEILQRIITLDESALQDELSLTAQHLTGIFLGKDSDQIFSISTYLQGIEKDISGWVVKEMGYADSASSGEVFFDGLTNVLSEPEFAGSEKTRRSLRLLEERTMLQDLLARITPADSVGGVQVVIGGEGTNEELSQVSIILARYGTPGTATGALGVFGPIRMSYGRTISTVRFMSSLLSELVSDNLLE